MDVEHAKKGTSCSLWFALAAIGAVVSLGAGIGTILLGAAETDQHTASQSWKIVAGALVVGAGCLSAGLWGLRWSGRVGDAVKAFGAGERCPEALAVQGGNSSVSKSWNGIMEWVGTMHAADRADRAQQILSIGVARDGDHSLTAAVDALWIGMVLLDEQMVIRQSNGAAASQLRCSKDLLNGTALQDLLPDERLMKAAKSIATGLVRRRCSVAVEHTSEDGGRSVLRCSVRPVRKSESVCVLLVIEDVTQQHEADRARSELVAQAAHELRTPLTNIRLYIEELLDGFDAMTGTERGESLSVINQETRRLERIVADMLSMSEIEAGKLSIVHDDVRMEDVLGALKNDYSAMARDKGLTLVFDLSPKLPVLRGDRDKISLAMHNLVSNALKYTPPGGEVRVTAESEPDRFLFQVSDTGIGINAEQLERIFERFYRCNDERTVDVAGTGLGLSLAREVARLHGGDVTADSVPDKGSTFILELPTAA
jgi:PAS domain S-box-containing protein